MEAPDPASQVLSFPKALLVSGLPGIGLRKVSLSCSLPEPIKL